MTSVLITLPPPPPSTDLSLALFSSFCFVLDTDELHVVGVLVLSLASGFV